MRAAMCSGEAGRPQPSQRIEVEFASIRGDHPTAIDPTWDHEREFGNWFSLEGQPWISSGLPATLNLAGPLNTRAFVGTNPKDESITSGLPVNREAKNIRSFSFA